MMRTPFLVLLALCGLVGSCSVDQHGGPGVEASSSAGSSGVNMRDVVGDFCPPAQATKGNC
jgi:hypothetical protein